MSQYLCIELFLHQLPVKEESLFTLYAQALNKLLYAQVYLGKSNIIFIRV